MMADGPYWTLDHYEPKAGKNLGFWHAGGTSPSWQEMKDKWAFTWIVVTSQGYSPARRLGLHTMVTVGPTGFEDVISSCPDAERFYSDEVNDNPEWRALWDFMSMGHPPTLLPIDVLPPYVFHNVYQIMSNISSQAYASGSKYIISDYGQISNVLRKEVDLADGVMYSSYKYFPSYGLPKSDQRRGWNDFGGEFQDKFVMGWIGGQIGGTDSASEYDRLIEKAVSMGRNELWFYYGSQGVDPAKLLEFTYRAWKWGYVRRFEHSYYNWYRCIEPNGCSSDLNCEGWKYDHVEFRTSPIVEVFP
jgi:hypothetical protein